jgi:hypothetical protein
MGDAVATTKMMKNMRRVAWASAILLAVVGAAGLSFLLTAGGGLNPWGDQGVIICPADGSPYVWTPVGTRSENFQWKCLRCGYEWMETYPEDTYNSWKAAFLEPDFVRDYAILYLRTMGHDLPDPLSLAWTGGRETPEGLLGSETYVYRAAGITVTVRYPVVLAENTVYEIWVERGGAVDWHGTLHLRRFEAFPVPS